MAVGAFLSSGAAFVEAKNKNRQGRGRKKSVLGCFYARWNVSDVHMVLDLSKQDKDFVKKVFLCELFYFVKWQSNKSDAMKMVVNSSIKKRK